MELSGLSVQQQMQTLQGAVNGDMSQQSAAPAEAAKPLFSDNGVKVLSSSDYEKLLAKLESEEKETKLKTNLSYFNAALMFLTGRHGNVSAAYDELNAATATLTEASAATAEAQAAYDTSSATLNRLNADYDKKVSQLEALEKDKAAAEAQAIQEGRDPATDPTVAALTGEIASLQEKTSALETQISAEMESLEDEKQALSAAQYAETQAAEAVATAAMKLDAMLAKDVLLAAALAARQLSAALREQSEAGLPETVKTVEELAVLLDSYVSRLDEMKDDEIKEAVSKVAPDLAFLVTANYAVAPGDLPQYERRV